MNTDCTFTSTRGQKIAGAPRTKILEDRLRRARSLISKLQAQNPSPELDAEVSSIFESPPGSPSSESDFNEATDSTHEVPRSEPRGQQKHNRRQSDSRLQHIASQVSLQDSASEMSEASQMPSGLPSSYSHPTHRPQMNSAPPVLNSVDPTTMSMYIPQTMAYSPPVWDPSMDMLAMGHHGYYAQPGVPYSQGPISASIEVPYATELAWSYQMPTQTRREEPRSDPSRLLRRTNTLPRDHNAGTYMHPRSSQERYR